MIQSIKIQEQLEYSHFREFIGEKVATLLRDKDFKSGELLHFVKACYAWDNWSIIKNKKNELEYFLIHDPIFKAIIHDDLIEKASKSYPYSFGTNNPENVIKALNNTININYNYSIQEWSRQTSYVAITNTIKSKVLYLGLFRDIGNRQDSSLEFKSGYLHSLKHFSGKDNQPITSSNESQIIPDNLIEHIVRCLFEGNLKDEKKDPNIKENKTLIYEYYMDSKGYEFVFYYSHIFDIYFLSTIHRK